MPVIIDPRDTITPGLDKKKKRKTLKIPPRQGGGKYSLVTRIDFLDYNRWLVKRRFSNDLYSSQRVDVDFV